MIKRTLKTLLVLASVAALGACGRSGTSEEESASLGPMMNISGSMTTQIGGQREMANWVAVLLEKNTSIARVGEADVGGLFTFKQARTNEAQTIAFLSPDYIFSSILAMPGREKTVRQYFNLKPKTQRHIG